MISIEKCKDGWLYIIYARNSYIGIYKASKKSFIISRTKFKAHFIYEEDHWETGKPFGTAKPLKELFKVPENIINSSEKELLEYLDNAYNEKKEEIKNTLSKYLLKNINI